VRYLTLLRWVFPVRSCSCSQASQLQWQSGAISEMMDRNHLKSTSATALMRTSQGSIAWRTLGATTRHFGHVQIQMSATSRRKDVIRMSRLSAALAAARAISVTTCGMSPFFPPLSPPRMRHRR
ncbi:hypothetical protein PMAYCL1PPCAC_09018, partial [Pristionchus mayeri]